MRAASWCGGSSNHRCSRCSCCSWGCTGTGDIQFNILDCRKVNQTREWNCRICPQINVIWLWSYAIITGDEGSLIWLEHVAIRLWFHIFVPIESFNPQFNRQYRIFEWSLSPFLMNRTTLIEFSGTRILCYSCQMKVTAVICLTGV